MDIKAIGEAELAAVADTFIRTFNESPWHEQWSAQTAHTCLLDLLHLPHAVTLAAWSESQCLGAILGFNQQKDTGLTHEIKEFFVHPQMQERGVGRALLTAYLEIVEQKEVNSIYLLTARESPAESVYERFGFRRARRQVVMVRP